MSEEGRTAPAQKPLEPSETLPDLGPPPSVSEITAIDDGDRKPPPDTLLAPVAALALEDEDAVTLPMSAREVGTGARRRGRMSLRIPDDEVARPLDVRAEAPRSVPPAPAPAAAPAEPAGPFRLAAASAPVFAPVPAPPAPSSDPSIDVPITEEPLEAAAPHEPPLVAVTPMRIISVGPAPRESAPEYVTAPAAAPLPSMVALDEPPPSLVAVEEEEVHVDDDEGWTDRPSEPPDDISMEDVVEEAPKSLPEAPPAMPSMRPRATSTPPAPPPPTRRPVLAPRSAPAQAPPSSKPPLVIVPPHVGTMGPQSTESSGLRRKGRLWWEDLFNDDYLRTAEKLTDAQIAREAGFIEDRLGIERGGSLLDLACGTGRHAIELARRGYEVVGFDLSLAMLARAGDEAQDREVKINFVQGDMREMTFEEQFDGVYCWGTSFGYFEEEKNANVIDRVRRALRAGGLLLLDVVNRDFLVRQSPSLAWFEGDGCVCMDEMNVDFITSRMKVKRTMMLDDGRTREIEYSTRVYSLHELGKILHEQGFKVCEVSGRTATPGVFFGNESPRTIVLAEKR
jgi:SAM-dependent methyltransferase